MVNLILVRHGETKDNAEHIMQGQTPGELNENGRRQARELASRLAGERIDVFVASDLWRSVETCEILARPHGVGVVTTRLLRERDWGSFTGRFIPSLAHLDNPDLWPADIEPLDELKARAGAFLDWIRGEFPSRRVLAVGHGIINKAVQSVYYGRPMGEICPMKNLEMRVLEL